MTKKMISIDEHAPENSRKKLIYFFLSLVIAVIITFILTEPDFKQTQINVLFLLLFSIGLWLTEAVPAFAVGILIIAFMVFSTGYKAFTDTPQDIRIYLNTFSSSVIWLMLGGFFLATAMTKSRLDLDLVKITLRICGKKPKWILFGMMAVTMTASMLISNTATTAMVVAAVMPLMKKMGKKSNVAKGLILGIALAATTGGMGTMIGSPPNAIASGELIRVGSPVDFIQWMYFGIPVTLVLTFLSWFMLSRIYMKDAKVIDVRHAASVDNDEINAVQRVVVMMVLGVTLILWLTSPLHGLSAAAVSAVPLVFLTLTGVITGDDVKAMGWDTLILVAGGLSLGIGLQQNGLLDIYATKISSLPVPETAFYFLLAYATMIFSNVMSNTATSTVLIPLGMAILPAHKMEVAMIIGLAASTALFLPVSTPPNAIVYSTGFIGQKDFRAGGILAGLLGPALIVLWVLLVA